MDQTNSRNKQNDASCPDKTSFHSEKNGEGKKYTNPWFFALYIGFFAGVIWGFVKIAAYYFRFTTVIPGFLVEPFYKHDFLLTGGGILVGWIYFILFSILGSFVYMLLLGKLKGPVPGILYGIGWWMVLYYIVGPGTGMFAPVTRIGWDTIIADFCLFLLWGLFIGFSTAFEFTEETGTERKNTTN